MLSHDRTLLHEGVIDHHLSIPMGEDYYTDMIVSIYDGAKTWGFFADHPKKATLEIYPNVQGERLDEKGLTVNISIKEAERLIALCPSHPTPEE